MSQITRCPACGTKFKIVADQLRISQGWVRCGHCKELFDATASLQPAPPPAPMLPDLVLGHAPADSPPSPARPQPQVAAAPWPAVDEDPALVILRRAAAPPAARPAPVFAPTPAPAPRGYELPAADLPEDSLWPEEFSPEPSPPPQRAPAPAVAAPAATLAPAAPGATASPAATSITLPPRPLHETVRSVPAAPAPRPAEPVPRTRPQESAHRAAHHAEPDPQRATPRQAEVESALQPQPLTAQAQPARSPAAPSTSPVAQPATGAAQPDRHGTLGALPEPPAAGVGAPLAAATPALAAQAAGAMPAPAVPDDIARQPLSPPPLAGAAPEHIVSPSTPQPHVAGDGDAAPVAVAAAPLPTATPAPAKRPAAAPESSSRRRKKPLAAPVSPAPSEPSTATEYERFADTDADTSPHTLTAPEPSFVRAARRKAFWRRPATRAVLVLGALALAAMLATQIALHERNTLAVMEPRLRPALAALCVHADCELAPRQQIADAVIDSSSFYKPARGDGYLLAITLKNRSTLPLAMPAVELTLTDMTEQPVLRRVLRPNDLGAPAELPGQGEWSATLPLSLTDPGLRIGGYRVVVFYP